MKKFQQFLLGPNFTPLLFLSVFLWLLIGPVNSWSYVQTTDPKNSNKILSTTINYSAENAEIIFETAKFPKFRLFTLSSPERLVIDFQDVSDISKIKFPENKIFRGWQISKNGIGDVRISFNLYEKILAKKSTDIKQINGNYHIIITLPGDYQPNLNKDQAPIGQKKIHYQLSPLNSEIADQILAADQAQSAIVAVDVGKDTVQNTNNSVTQNSSNSPEKTTIKFAKKKPVIVIDAGHGGKDPGATGKFLRTKEKNLTLSYALELKKHLDKSKKFRTYLTRSSDFFIPLSGRVAKARAMKADLFISIHADSAENNAASGLSIYTLSETSSDKQAELLAAKENKADIIGGIDFSDASNEVLGTLISMAQRETMNSSARFAQMAINKLHNEDMNVVQNTHRFAGFKVLTAPDMASVLIELGYLSNKKEEKRLNSSNHRRKVAMLLSESIADYFEK